MGVVQQWEVVVVCRGAGQALAAEQGVRRRSATTKSPSSA